MGWVVRYPDEKGPLSVAGNRARGQFFDTKEQMDVFCQERERWGGLVLDVMEVFPSGDLVDQVRDLQRLVWLLLHKAGDVVVVMDDELLALPAAPVFEVLPEPETFSTIYATREARLGR